MYNEKTLRVRYFVFAFSVAFFMLSLFLLFLLSFSTHKEAPVVIKNEELSESVFYAPASEDKLTVLFMIVPKINSSPNILLLAKFDPTAKSVFITIIPSQLVVDNNGKAETIGTVYEYGGAVYTKNILEENLKIDIDRYARMNTVSFISVTNAIGAINFDIPYKITTNNNGANVIFNSGMQVLSGEKIAQISSSGTVEQTEHVILLTDIACEIVNQHIGISENTMLDSIFETIVNLVDTDISFTDYYKRKEAAGYLSSLKTDVAIPLILEGEWNSGSSQMVLSDISRFKLEQYYS